MLFEVWSRAMHVRYSGLRLDLSRSGMSRRQALDC